VNDLSHGKRWRPVESRRVNARRKLDVHLSFEVKNLWVLPSYVIRSRRGRMPICSRLLSCNRYAYIILVFGGVAS
jgi:hypothetical protein